MPIKSHNVRVTTSSSRDDWATPQAFYEKLNAEFSFQVDVCANETNKKHDNYIGVEMDAFSAPWRDGDSQPYKACWMNPPYGRGIRHWMQLAFEKSLLGSTVVCLVPNRAGSKWWSDTVLGKADEVRFVNGRLAFDDGTEKATFESAVVIFRAPQNRRYTHYTHTCP